MCTNQNYLYIKITISNRLDWDRPNENEIYLEYVANILTGKRKKNKKTSKNLCEEKIMRGKTNLKTSQILISHTTERKTVPDI